MNVSKEEIVRIADLADLILDESEIDSYHGNIEDILNFANTLINAPVENLNITIGASESKNIFRKDEVKEFDNIEGLLQNAPSIEQHMFKIPKVVQ